MLHQSRFAGRLLTAGFLSLLLIGGTASGQMHITVEADRVRLGASEFVPRFTDLPTVLTVPAGRTVTLPPDSTWDAIEVAGTLRVSRTADTVVRFIHLLILPGGTLDVGTASDPILRSVEFIVRDVPVDTARDPFQWGNGIVNFGRQTRVGRQVTPAWTELADDAQPGATMVRLTAPASNWRVGDALLIPDTAQIRRPPYGSGTARKESPVSIQTIAGDTITLSKPLDFEHLAIRDPQETVIARPRIANMTRNIVIRSENPDGTRGHTANVGHEATWDIRYNQFVGLGRTRNQNLDNTGTDVDGHVTHLGTNQIGRYANHDHHAHGFGSKSIGNTYDGLGRGKWAHAVHGTHDSLLEDEVAANFLGGCFVTEDGYEVRNIFRRNVCAYSVGNGIQPVANVDLRRGNNCPGCEGSGFWFRGPKQIIESNEAWNNPIGINLFNQGHVNLTTLIPSKPGGEPDITLDPKAEVPIALRNNVTLSNTSQGLEFWSTPRFPAENHLSANNGAFQMLAGQSRNLIYLVNPVLIATGGIADCVSSNVAYVQALEISGGRLAGCRKGLSRGGATAYVRLRNLTMQNVTNIEFETGLPQETLFENVQHQQFGTLPRRYLVFGRASVWQPGQPLPTADGGRPWWFSQDGSHHVIRNWQGSGQDYTLLEKQQDRSTSAWPADGTRNSYYFAPEAGLTMGQSWDKYGLAYKGDVVGTEGVPLDGLINGIARAGLGPPLGIPRAVLTYPNMISPAIVVSTNSVSSIRAYILLTGDPMMANEYAVTSIDGGPPVRRLRSAGAPTISRNFRFTGTAINPGIHTVVTWREDPMGVKIPASELTFRYMVGSAPAPPAEGLQ